jgi:hypothetical protein
MESLSPPMIRVGTRRLDQDLVRFHGASGTAACSDGRVRAASRLPPPPIECPETASRLASIRLRTELRWVR